MALLNNPPQPENREGFSPVVKGDIIRVPWMDGRPLFQVELVTTDGYPRIKKDGMYHTIHQYELFTGRVQMAGSRPLKMGDHLVEMKEAPPPSSTSKLGETVTSLEQPKGE